MELIHIQQTTIGKGAVNSVNARELHAKLEIKSRFNDWIANRLSDFIENEDYIVVTKNLVTEGKDVILTVDTAKHISMIERSEIGRRIRQYFIECEKQATKQLSTLDQIALIAKGTLELSETVQRHTADIETLKQDIALNSREKHALKAAVGSRIASFNLKPENIKKIYAAVWKKVKDRFLVSSYMEIPRLQFLDALHFVQNISMEDLV